MPWYMYFIIGLIVWAVLSVPLGMCLGAFIAAHPAPDDFDPYMTFHRQLQIECPDGHAPKRELCDLPGVWICVERFKDAEITAWVDEDQEGDIYE